MGGGRDDRTARAQQRLWYAASVAGAGIPMAFMGAEWGQPGWWDAEAPHRLRWDLSDDGPGRELSAAMSAVNALRAAHPVLRHGLCGLLQADESNGVVAVERTDGRDRCILVVNAGGGEWGGGGYGCWVGGGIFEEIHFSGGDGGFDARWVCNPGRVVSHGGRLWLNLPARSSLVLKQVFEPGERLRAWRPPAEERGDDGGAAWW